MADGMDIVIQALDMASEVFSQISSSAQEMFDNITGGSDEASSGVEQVGDSAGEAGSEMDNAGDSAGKMGQEMDNASQATDLLVGAMEGVVATEIASALNDCIDKAASYESQMNSLSLTFGESTVNSEAFKNAISTASETTGRAGGNVREYFNQMGIAGVKNTSLLSQSFESLSGRAVQTGGNIDNMGSLMQKMVLSGNVASRSLTQLGLSTDDLGRAMGVSGDEATKMFSSLSQEERLRVLTQAMGDGSRANNMYKNSFEGMKQQLENQLGLTARNIGSSVLPLLTNGLKIATPVINGFATALGNPIIGGAVGTITAVAAGLIGLSAASKMAQIAINGYRTAVTIANTVSALYSAGIAAVAMAKEGVTLAEILNTGMTSSNTAVKIVATAAHYALAVAQGVVKVATLALNAAMEANPIGLVVIAVMALVAALLYLYNNNETVRAAVDALSSALQGGLGAALAWIQGAINNTIQFFQNLWNTFTQGPTKASEMVTGILVFIATLPIQIPLMLLQVATKMSPQLQKWVTTGKTKAKQMVTGIINNIKNLPGKVWTYLKNVLSKISSAGTSWGSKAKTAGKKIHTGVINGIGNIANAVFDKFKGIASAIDNARASAVTAAQNFGAKALAAFKKAINSASPSDFYKIPANDFASIAGAIHDAQPGAVREVKRFGKAMIGAYDGVESGFNIQTDFGGNVSSSDFKRELDLNINHDFSNLPNGVSAEEVARIVLSSTENEEFARKLANSKVFQNWDLRVKQNLASKSRRNLGV